MLRVRLLGELDVRDGDTPLPPLESARAASLVAYLLLHRQAPQARQRLAFLLWPESTEAQAQTNLRHVLHNLRRALPRVHAALDVTPRTLPWRPTEPVWLDVAAVEAALARAEREAGEGAAPLLEEAVGLYAGDLLEGSYDEWVVEERERLRQRYLDALERLSGLLEERGEQARAIPYAERLLRHDPLREEAYRLLMRLHDARGDRARALRVYHACAAALERELGVEPSAQTREAYEAILPARRASGTAQRPASRVGGPALVGRAAEWSRLTTLWRTAEAGAAQLVLVTGEPGIGKTRLIEELREWCAHRGAATAVARSYAAEGALAYAPVVEWLRAEAIGSRLRRLDGPRLSELSRLLPELRAELPTLARPDPLPEDDQRARLFDAATRAILSAGGPLLLIADDLQWWDRESLRFLHYLVRAQPEAPMLVAAAARSEELDAGHPLNELRVGLLRLGRLAEMELGRLSRAETAALAGHVAGRRLAEADAEQLYGETEGNPLFAVEALRAGWRGGRVRGALTSPKVQAVVASRLEQLSEPARGIVGLAATIGRAFTAEVLAAAGEADERVLVRGLDELWRRRIVREQGADAYDFSHDKIREVAHLALSPAQRRSNHRRVAQALERLHPDDPGTVSGQIAGHYDRAGGAGEAVPWYARAAEEALRLHAHAEAVRLLDRALVLLHTLPPTTERDARELEILTALPASLLAVEGYGSRRYADIHRRAGELAHRLGVEPAPPILRSLALASLSTGDFNAAREAGEHLRARGVDANDDVLLVEGAYVLGIAAFWSGELEAARRHFEAAVSHYRAEHRRAHLLRYGQDPKVVCLGRLAVTLWLLGRPESAVRTRAAALAWAEEIGHPYTRAVAFVFAGVLALGMRDVAALRRCVTALEGEGPELELPHVQNPKEAFAGYLEVLDGRCADGIGRVQRVLDDPGTAVPAPGHYATIAKVLVEACAAAGDVVAGLSAADRALDVGGVRVWEAEVRRLRAELLAASGAPAADVEAELARALEVARGQGARTLELRAAASQLRLRLARGDEPGAHDARESLLAALSGLPEPADSADLRAAREL